MLKHSNVLTNWKYSTLYEQNIPDWPKFEKEQPMHLLQLYGHQCTSSNYMDNYMELNFTKQTL